MYIFDHRPDYCAASSSRQQWPGLDINSIIIDNCPSLSSVHCRRRSAGLKFYSYVHFCDDHSSVQEVSVHWNLVVDGHKFLDIKVPPPLFVEYNFYECHRV